MGIAASPDGRAGALLTQGADGRTAYGVRNNAGEYYLFSLDIAMAGLRDIRRLDGSLAPDSSVTAAIRFSMAPDGFAYCTRKWESSVWMLEGF